MKNLVVRRAVLPCNLEPLPCHVCLNLRRSFEGYTKLIQEILE